MFQPKFDFFVDENGFKAGQVQNPGMPTGAAPIVVKIVKDSITDGGSRLITWCWEYPRMIHSEIMTHRALCLAGDAVLEFELPAGNHGSTSKRRVYKMTIADFVGKWLHGSTPHRSRWGTTRTYDLKGRLMEMRIRQLDEATGEIVTSTVAAAIESGMKPVYEVTAGKYKVAGSADHRVMTGDGWKTIGELRIGDTLTVSTIKRPEHLKKDPLRLLYIDGRWRCQWQREQRTRLINESGICRQCRKSAGAEIHHVEPVHLAPHRAFDETNVTLLCDDCHEENHRAQGWQTGNPLYSGVVAIDGIRFRGVEPTYDLAINGPFPNFLANRVVVHNSRNSASSRAIPASVLRRRTVNNPVVPFYWGKNQKGMQAEQELMPDEIQNAQTWWLGALQAAAYAHELGEKLGLHKQIVNRLIEPWMTIAVVVSATDHANLFHLRKHGAAEPHFQCIAGLAWELFHNHMPTYRAPGQWHLPYVDEGVTAPSNEPERESSELADARKLSTARCARVSYYTHEGKRDSIEDIRLHDQLANTASLGADPMHASPFEHQAMAVGSRKRFANFEGWKQYRKFFVREAGPDTSRRCEACGCWGGRHVKDCPTQSPELRAAVKP